MLTGQILLQLIVILFAVQLFGTLSRRIGQQWVIGEILAGLALGPSLLGLLLPDLQRQIFPPASIPILHMLGDIGLILYMFSLGARTDVQELRSQSRVAAIISLSGIIVPLLLGFLLGFLLFPAQAGKHATPFSFALLMGVAMAITAFPVLARLLSEKRLLTTRIGMLSLVCASVGDVIAWCLLATASTVAHAQSGLSILLMLVFTALFIASMFLIVRPLFIRANRHIRSMPLLAALTFGTVLLASFTTDKIGIHPIFGAFLTGLILPRNQNFTQQIHSIDQVNGLLFLPLFFVVSGLRTQLGLIQSPALWLLCLVILLVACLGKIGGGTLSARISGESWRDSLTLGFLLNTRGLVELIVLNIGLELGILSQTLFSILVIMALVTTMLTSPCLYLLGVRPDTATPVKDKRSETTLSG
uniref:Cation/H+ exchanger transmembrane domain-containing protein n=1 Tax=Thermosporothrix sp. COM3 TaxID=2490863 RepID=A0A455SF87_9CHLR|nr:hypothetical protein KTC_18740 [Thermosporothrix sp. COM3]